MATKRFHLGDVLSITTGKLVSPRHIDGVYDILNWMTGDNLFTHQLPRASRECRSYLKTQFPILADEDGAGCPRSEHWKDWLDGCVKRYGEWFDVEPLPAHAHEFIDPISEAAEKIHPDRIIPITL